MRTTVCWTTPWILRALGLSLLVKPALSVPTLRVAAQKLISQNSVFRTTLLSVIN